MKRVFRLSCFLALLFACDVVLSLKQRRRVEFDPPRVIPGSDAQTVKAGEASYTFRCEGNAHGVSWHLPADASKDLVLR